MKVFLTGATGFLGAEIARELCARGHDCVALARSRQGADRLLQIAPSATVVLGDFFDVAGCQELLARCRPDALLHCGWQGVVGADRNDPRQFDNVAASVRLAEAALLHGARLLVGVGSQAEYGPRAEAIDEADPPAPETFYGAAKLSTCNAFSTLGRLHGARVVWGRVFSLYGPGQTDEWLIGGLIRAFLSGEAPALTPCAQKWEFTHVRDAAQAFCALLETPAAYGVFNVASGESRSLRDTVLFLRDLIAPQIEPRFGCVPYRTDQVMHLMGKVERIRSVTGWSPVVGLEEGFAETVAAFSSGRVAS